MPLLLDLTPLRVSPSYRRLWSGFTLSGVGAQLATVAIGLQVYDITRSTFAVGIVGLCALVPLVVMGLYGGAIVDHYDRRKVALAAGLLLWVVSILNTVQAALGNTHVGVLYALVGLYNAGFGVVSPARSAIYPRLLDRSLLPAANALSVTAMNISMTVGPLLAGLLVDWVATSPPTPSTPPCSPSPSGASCGWNPFRQKRIRRPTPPPCGVVRASPRCSTGFASSAPAPTCE